MARYLPLILFTVLTNAAAQILLKKGMMTVGRFAVGGGHLLSAARSVAVSPFVILGLFTLAISMASHLFVLSRVELSYAYPFLSLAYVVVAIYTYAVFGEDLNAYRMVGIALICAGTIFVSRS